MMGIIKNIEDVKFPQYLFWLKQYKPEDSIWAKVSTLKQYQNIVNTLLGNPQEGFEWEPYHIQGFDGHIAWVVDAGELLIQQSTPETLVKAIKQASIQLSLARYIDEVSNFDTQCLDLSFNGYYKDCHKLLNDRLALFLLQLEKEQDTDLSYCCICIRKLARLK